MDGWLNNCADIVKKKYPLSDMNAKGAGSAGGLGFAFMSFLSATFSSGIETVLTELNFEDKVKNTDIVFTGEGRLDGQTAMGKAPIGVAWIAKKYGKPVVALAGSVTPEATICNQNGIDAFFPVVRGVCTLDEALAKDNAYSNTADTAEQIYRLIKLKM
jgi:glycerate kinase